MADDKARQVINDHLKLPTGAFRLKYIWRGLATEIKLPGVRLTHKAPKCSTILRKEFGLSGAPPKLFAQFQTLLVEARVLDRDEACDPKPASAGGVEAAS